MNDLKWSRNLSAINQLEVNRIRLIAKQKLENKRDLQQQTIITSTRQHSVRTRLIKKLDYEDYCDLNNINEINKEKSLDSSLINKNQNLINKLNYNSINNESYNQVYKNKLNKTVEEKEKKKDNNNKNNNNNDNGDNKKDEENEKIYEDKKEIKVEKIEKIDEEKQNLNNFDFNKNLEHVDLVNLNKSNNHNNLIINDHKLNEKVNHLELQSNDLDKKKLNKSTLDNSKINEVSLNKFNDNLSNFFKNSLNTDTDLSLNAIQLNNTEVNSLKSLINNDGLFQFVVNQVPKLTTYQCTIIRYKKGIDRSLYPTYYMYLQAINSKNSQSKQSKNLSSSNKLIFQTTLNQINDLKNQKIFLLSGRRRKKSKTYLISCDSFEITRDNCIAKLKSNVLGTHFNTIRITQNNQRLDYASIIYETNVLGFKGPRKMTVFLPKNESTNNNKELTLTSNSNLIETFKNNPKSIIQLKNKTPVWSEETQSYVLNFKGRVTQASVKNFQLEQCNTLYEDDFIKYKKTSDHELKINSENNFNMINSFTIDNFIPMQFGRISNNEFTCDVSWPLSILQAFSIALSSFDSKLACE